VLALEADCGAGRPLGFGLSAGPEGLALAGEIAGLLTGVGADRFWEGGGGVDVNVLGEHGVPTMGLRNDESLYWHVHHTPADTLDRIDPSDLACSVAAVAVMAYVVADMPWAFTSSAPRDPGGCWTLCTERARRVISWAQEEAGQAGRPEVETEHLLLAMLREDNQGAGVLGRCGLSLDTLRSTVHEETTPGPAGSHRVTRLGRRARRALDLAREEGEAMDPGYVGCEQLLLGLLREKEGLAARVLARLGVTPEGCRREIPVVGEWWREVGVAEARLRDGDTPENRRRLQEGVRHPAALLYAAMKHRAIVAGNLIEETFGINGCGEGQEHPTDVLPVAQRRPAEGGPVQVVGDGGVEGGGEAASPCIIGSSLIEQEADLRTGPGAVDDHLFLTTAAVFRQVALGGF
jgi:hypothetical protein